MHSLIFPEQYVASRMKILDNSSHVSYFWQLFNSKNGQIWSLNIRHCVRIVCFDIAATREDFEMEQMQITNLHILCKTRQIFGTST